VAKVAIQSIVEGKDLHSWQQVGVAALNELWDNPEDAVYDAWQQLYRPGAR
jgi:hypothetical protein